MREILQRLLKPVGPERRFGTVALLLPDGRYVVADDQGQRMTVGGVAGYLPGTPVIIQSGRIVEIGSRPALRKTLRV